MEDQKYNLSTRMKIVDIVLGLRVDRAASTHLAAVTPYFTICTVPDCPTRNSLLLPSPALRISTTPPEFETCVNRMSRAVTWVLISI